MSDGKTTKTSFLKSGIGPKFFKVWMLVVIVVIMVMLISISWYEALQPPTPITASQASSVFGGNWTMSSKKNLNISRTIFKQYGYVEGFVVSYQNGSKMFNLYVLKYENSTDASNSLVNYALPVFMPYPTAGYLDGYRYIYYPYNIISLAKSNYLFVIQNMNIYFPLAKALALMKYQLGPSWMLYIEIGVVILIATAILLIISRVNYSLAKA